MRWWSGLRRVLRHLWWDASDSRRWVPEAVAHRLAQRVMTSERRHTGEIRLCIEASLPLNLWWPLPVDEVMPVLVRERALSWFGQLRVWDTQDNNGVLIYLQLAERSLEIVADRGLSQHVPADAWAAILHRLREHLAAGDVETGLGATIDAVDTLLCQHFPQTQGATNPNELPDAVVLC
jgi:uncharacterized membrane protein